MVLLHYKIDCIEWEKENRYDFLTAAYLTVYINVILVMDMENIQIMWLLDMIVVELKIGIIVNGIQILIIVNNLKMIK